MSETRHLEEQEMTTLKATEVGTVSLVELTTTDMESIAGFYQHLLGWDYTSLGHRSLAEAEGRRAAVISPRSATIGDMPLPGTWTVGFRTDDLRAAVERAEELGGTVIEPPAENPEGWRAAQLADPTGAGFSLIEAGPDFGIQAGGTGIGTPGWCELLTDDMPRAEAFYRALFGWTSHFDAATAYTTFKLGGDAVAGMMGMPPEAGDAPAFWMPYFNVDDVAAAVVEVAGLGGKITVAPREYGSMRFAVVEDPQGATFSLLEHVSPSREAESPETASGSTRLTSRLSSLIREGNRRHIVISDKSGRRVFEMPVTAGVLGAAIAPVASAAGTVAALTARWDISVVIPPADEAPGGES
jgi:uncharacterized protein